MKETYSGVTISLGNTQIYGEGWSFTNAWGLSTDFGRNVVKLVDNGATIEDVGGENGSFSPEFCKDFPTLADALNAFATLRAAVKAEGAAELVASWTSGTTTQSSTLASSAAVQGMTMSVQPMFYAGDSVIRLTITYNILTV